MNDKRIKCMAKIGPYIRLLLPLLLLKHSLIFHHFQKH